MFWKRKEEPAVILIDSHNEIVAEYEKDAQRERDTAARLLGKNVALRSEVAELRAELADESKKDEGATYVLKSLADALHVEDWSIQNGSEEWEGDVWATMFRILIDAGVVEEDHHTVATHAEIAALRPDAEKYRERCRRDREHAENARERKRAARKEAA